MSLDDQLPDLLTDAARGADRVPPTMPACGPPSAAEPTRRQRQRRVAGAVAGSAFVVACVAGAVAVSGTDDDGTADPASPTTWEGEVPYVGLEIPGFHLERTEGEQPVSVGLDIAVVLFTDGTGSADGPVLHVSATPPSEPTDLADVGVPVDLDGDGAAGGPEDGWLDETESFIAVGWRLADGGLGAVGGVGQSAEQVLSYARGLDRTSFDPLQAPTPDGLPRREVLNLADGNDQRVAYYTGEESDAGTTWTFHVLTLDQTGWFDLLRVPGNDDEEQYVEVPLGDSFLGPGVALLREVSGGDGDALIRTDRGLTIQVVGPQVARLRDAIEAGHFVELEPTGVPGPTTSVVNPVETSVPDRQIGAAGSGTAVGAVNLTGLWVDRYDDEHAIVYIQFDQGIPQWEVSVGAAQQPGGEGSCVLAQPATDTWLNVVVGTPGGGGVSDSLLEAGFASTLDDGPPVTATVTCEPFEGAARVDVALPDPVPRPTELRVEEDLDLNALAIIIRL